MATDANARLVALRRGFHRHPEPAWCEFYTTYRLVEELESIGVDRLVVGPDAYDPDDRMAVPSEDVLQRWADRAADRGADPGLLEHMSGGNTGVVAVLDRGEGPAVGLRVDIDGLHIEESAEAGHRPHDDGFHSAYPETMHACAHDAHMTIGLGVIERVKETDFFGKLVVFFQPAEEVAGGGYAMAESSLCGDLDHLLAVHVGLGHETGRIVAGTRRTLAMCHLDIEFRGASAHAGNAPEKGNNAIQALGTAIQNVYAIPRHNDGLTRVNIGRVEGGSASNIIAERVRADAEARGETSALMEYARDRMERTIRHAAAMHGCDHTFDVVSWSPRADSDPRLSEFIAEVAGEIAGVEDVIQHADFGASEDATFLMQRVQNAGGEAAYLIVGTDHPSEHHTPRFDIDERSLEIGVNTLTEVICRLGAGE